MGRNIRIPVVTWDFAPCGNYLAIPFLGKEEGWGLSLTICHSIIHMKLIPIKLGTLRFGGHIDVSWWWMEHIPIMPGGCPDSIGRRQGNCVQDSHGCCPTLQGNTFLSYSKLQGGYRDNFLDL